MKIILNENYKRSYNSVWFPQPWWSPKKLFDPDYWSKCCYPSYYTAFSDLIDNVLAFLSPWFKWRRILFQTFANDNGTKLLSGNRNSVSVRTRDGTQTYYTIMACRGFGAKLIRQVYKDENGQNCNLFMQGVAAMFSGDESKLPVLHAVTEVVHEQKYCMTRKQCQGFLDAIVKKAPDMEWFQFQFQTEE